MEGEVKFFNEKKGFGFIQSDDQQDVFIHISGVKEGIILKEGERVRFETVETDRGVQAKKVELI